MRILALTSSYPRYVGDPTAPFIESLTTSVAALGHDVDVVLPSHREWSRPVVDGRVRYHPFRYSPLKTWTPWGYSEALSGGTTIKRPLYALAPVVAVAAVRALKRVLRESPCDVVHAHWVIPNGPLAARAASAAGLPLVVSLHGSDLALAEKSRVLGRAARWTFARAAAVTAPSEDLLDRARRIGARGDLRLVPYGVDVEAFSASAPSAAGSSADRIVVMGIGRFIPVKGFEYLIDAVASARATCPQVELVLVGDGELRGALEDRARSRGIAEHVRFTGMATRADVPRLFGEADLVVVPSVHAGGLVDGLPNVALEAMAAAKAVVATRVGGLPELIRGGETGLLVEEQDAAVLAESIVTLARDPELRARLGHAARQEIVEHRTWPTVAAQLVDVYAAAIGRSAP